MIDGLTRLVVAAALYCNAPWANPFDPTKTDDEDFRLAGSGNKRVRMMKMEKVEDEESPKLPYLRDGDLQAIRLPYATAVFLGRTADPQNPT